MEEKKTRNRIGNELVSIAIANCKELLKIQGKTMEELSEYTGYAKSWFSKEHDDIYVSRLIKIGEFFDVEPQKLWDKEFTTEIRIASRKAEIERLQKEIEDMTGAKN